MDRTNNTLMDGWNDRQNNQKIEQWMDGWKEDRTNETQNYGRMDG